MAEQQYQLTLWGQQAKEHWKQYRPKMYRDLQQQGQLQRMLYRAQEATKEEYAQMVHAGMDSRTAWEMVRERYLFLPDEKDVPMLGMGL